ncbi:uncharacterized protein LOC141588466 [Silene latifolia]|uniref:uncharacterized protein LOC141588466 n=1 Tax=Silene latifolia TaxID=37657 RepID=UPI003D77AE4A
MDYKPSTNSSWVWKRIFKVKEDMVAGYINGKWNVQPDGYTPAGCYDWFKVNRPRVHWYKAVWNGWVIPKHQFLGWLIAHEALNTTSKLAGFGVDIEDKCCLCGLSEETTEHLFCDCVYSKRVITEVNKQARWDYHVRDVLRWSVQRTGTMLQRGVQSAMMMSILYQIWHQRNKCKNENALLRPEYVAKHVIEKMRSRVRGRDRSQMTIAEMDWLKRMRLVE